MDSIIAIPLPGQPVSPDGDRNPRTALPEFLAGPENRLVEPAVRSMLADPPGGYNPLVFCGPAGTGKSHLARGLAAAWKARDRRCRVVCTTAAEFASELAEALQTQAIGELRARYREAALLVLEDIDRLAGKYNVQGEMVNTLDALFATHGQVVATASAAPARLAGIMPSLQSRLDCGLVVPLAPPGPGARVAILRQLAPLRKIALSESAAHTLAKGLSVTVPELLDALVQLEMPARLLGGTVDADAARRFLALRNGCREAPLRDIASAAGRFFGLKLSELRGASRKQAVVTARGVAMYLARRLTAKSFEQIGRYFGGRDHTTAMYGCRKTERLLENDPPMYRAVAQLEEQLQKS